jgi:hypothetical protein
VNHHPFGERVSRFHSASVTACKRSLRSTYHQRKASAPTLENQTMGVDQRTPSNMASDRGWNTGVGKNCSVWVGMSRAMWTYQGAQRRKASFNGLPRTRSLKLASKRESEKRVNSHHESSKQRVTITALWLN